MKNAIFIAANDLRLFLRERGNLLGLLVIPVVLTIVLGMFIPAGGNGEGSVPVDVVDADRSESSLAFLDALRRANSSLVLCPMDNDEDDACDLDDSGPLDLAQSQARIADGDALGTIVIPDGYQEALDDGEGVEISFFSDPSLTSSTFIQQALQTAVEEVNGVVQAGGFGELLVENLPGYPDDAALRGQFLRSVQAEAAALWAENPVRVEYRSTARDEVRSSTAPPGFSQSVPGMATMYVMGTVFAGMVVLIGEKKRWTLQRLVMMPIAGSTILGGKLSGRFTLGIIQFLVVFAVGALVGMYFGESPLALILIMVSYTLAMTAISFALGTYLSTEAQAGALAQLLVLTLAPLGGAWWPLEITPRALQIIGHISPVAWAMDGFHDLFLRGGDLETVLPEILVLFGFALVFALIGRRRFRYA